MSVYDLFRGFFGFRGERRARDPFFGGITRDDDEDDDEDDEGPSFGARPSDDFGFGFTFAPGGMHFHENFGFDELFRDFNNLFNEMGSWTLPPQPFEFPGMEAPPSANHSREKRQTLRDSMLKYPDSHRPSQSPEDGLGPTVPERRPWRPFQGLEERGPAPSNTDSTPKEDKDLDSRVTSEGLETILPPAQPRTYFKSISVTKVMTPDGTVEECRTVRDSQGHEETVVTRQSRGEPYHGLDGSQQGRAGDLARPGEDMGDSSSILNAFFHRWFQGR
ncbi:HCLS1-associated protein X-1 [Eublepharis macularius]|uniref:HCLS1-associated protein X-1 n=1 Tax=Eublepharis macularius TaxID=481883 RepID=A0AA97KJ81_EUBMA|nr:HCLS1-associated protein X-1 [Eublepharis macularius]XP_054857668.1 HCLS1-associated protein X-1 [Eublepharis macularius]